MGGGQGLVEAESGAEGGAWRTWTFCLGRWESSRKAMEDGPCLWAPATHVGDSEEASAWHSSNHCGHLESDPADGKCLSVILPLSFKYIICLKKKEESSGDLWHALLNTNLDMARMEHFCMFFTTIKKNKKWGGRNAFCISFQMWLFVFILLHELKHVSSQIQAPVNCLKNYSHFYCSHDC